MKNDPVGDVESNYNPIVYIDEVCKHILGPGTYMLTRVEVDGIAYLSYFCPWCDSKALLSFAGLKYYEDTTGR